MLLKDKLIELGETLFKYRSYQFLLYLAAVGFSWKHLFLTKDNFYYEVICVLVAFIGMVIRAITVGFVSDGTSGRNTKHQVAEELNTTGIYSIVRNPLYIGNFLIFLGVIMLTQDFKTILLVSLLYWLFYMPIILTEENFLLGKFKDDFVNYTNNVPCLIPNFKLFKKANRKFSIAMVLYREQDTMLNTILLFLGAEAIMEYAQIGVFHIDKTWIYATILLLCFYGILKLLKKKQIFIKSVN